jgi:hypothetical protein
VKAYEAGGWKAVDVDRGGRPVGSGRLLSVEPEREVQGLILVKGATKKIYLILDNLRVHHSKPVKAWLADHKHEIEVEIEVEVEVFHLPSYSPEFNPKEMANADLTQAVTTLAPARTRLQLVKATSKHLSSVQQQPERFKSHFQHEPARYAA